MSMENPDAIKRRGYLTMFKYGVADGLLQNEMDISNKSSAYYKQGYEFGQSFNFKYVYVGDEKENQTYYLHTKEEANGR